MDAIGSLRSLKYGFRRAWGRRLGARRSREHRGDPLSRRKLRAEREKRDRQGNADESSGNAPQEGPENDGEGNDGR